jgi:PAS domain S-box-containing protein
MSGGSNEIAAARLREAKQWIIDTWERRVRERVSVAHDYDRSALIDDVPDILEELAGRMEVAREDLDESVPSQAVAHGRQRAERTGFALEQVILEYQLLHRLILDALDRHGRLDPSIRDTISGAVLRWVNEAASAFERHRLSAVHAILSDTDLRFRHMVDTVKDYAIFTLNPRGIITSWNEGCMRMKLYTSEEAIGKHFEMLYPDEGRRRDEPMGHLRTAAIESRFRGEGIRVRKNGEHFIADVSITAIFEGGSLTGFTKVVQDLTERAALMQERDLSRLDSEQLRAEAEYREQFVATLTHDLRSPLAAARAGAELIEGAADNPVKVRAWARRIADSLHRADRMIGDLLDASRLSAGERPALTFEKLDLAALARQMCDDMAPRYGNRFVTEVDGSPVGYWSPDGMRRVLDNLLSNAIKYGEKDRPITVRVKQIDDRMLLSVHNYGTIIPKEEQARLFQPFHRAPSAQVSGTPGWGIGLTLVKGIVEAHGGIVKAESYPIEGTLFTADLPMDARNTGAMPLTPQNPTE